MRELAKATGQDPRQDVALEIGARLDRMPMTGFHHRLSLIVAAGLIVDAVDVAVAAGVSGALLREGFADLAGVGRLAVATSLGLALGGLLTGFLADRFGRLGMMRITIVLIAAGGIGCAYASSLEQLLVWRLLVALALGGETVLAYGMIAEFMPKASRGRWMAWVALIASAGLPMAMGLGYFILSEPGGWRRVLAVPAIAALGVLALRFLLEESPRWLAARGAVAKALDIIGRVEASARGALVPATPDMPKLQGAPLSQSGLASRMTVAVAVNIAGIGAVYGFVNWLPAFFVAEGRSVASSSMFTALMTAGAPAGAIAAFLIADKFERKWSVAASALAAALLGVLYATAKSAAAIVGLGFLVVMAVYACGTLGMFAYAPELFATGIRLRALGAASAAGRLFAIALPFLVVPIFGAAGQPGVIALVAGLLAVEAATVAALGPRTRGRSLDSL